MSIKYKFEIPGPDTAAGAKFAQFRTGAVAHLVTLGYDIGDLDEIIAADVDFNTALTNAEAKKVETRTAVAVKSEARVTSTEVIMEWVDRVKSNALATPEMLADFGIEPFAGGAAPAIPPVALAAIPSYTGTCTLTRSRTNNIKGTTFILEFSLDGDTWQWLSSTTKTKFVDTNATPGAQRIYRIRAQRAGVTSAPGSWATIYPAGGGDTLQVEA